MIDKLKAQLTASPTAYHVVETAEKQLLAAGFAKLDSASRWKLSAGDKAYVVVDGSALIAFCVGDCKRHYAYNIVASHTDSPCFKIKLNAVMSDGEYKRLSIEEYGKSLHYTWFDRPLGIAGRVIVKNKKSGALESRLFKDSRRYVIPSLAIHQNREANNELRLNILKDLKPLFGTHDGRDFVDTLFAKNPDYTIVEYDLFLYSASEPFFFGAENEFLCAPRLDNQTSAFASIEALISSKPEGVSMAFLADNEEVGSLTKKGAGATILKDIISRINSALGFDEEQLKIALVDSFVVSCDNAHAVHPNKPEMSDETNKNFLNKGVVIKHHACQKYTTDAFSSAIIKQIFQSANIKYQNFFNRSDLLSGGSLGSISSGQLSIRSVDIGLPQLAMHSSAETMGTSDYTDLITGLTKFYSAQIKTTSAGIVIQE